MTSVGPINRFIVAVPGAILLYLTFFSGLRVSGGGPMMDSATILGLATLAVAVVGLWPVLAERLLTLGEGQREIRATHQALASELGTAREVVSRVLNDFHKRNFIAQSRGVITFKDKAGLAAIAQSS